MKEYYHDKATGKIKVREQNQETQPPVAVQRLFSQPHRVKLSRKKGWKLPPNTVVVARPTKWGNPWKVRKHKKLRDLRDDCSPREAVEAYEQWLQSEGYGILLGAKVALRGKNLACFCKVIDEHGNYVPCHADILLALANGMNHDEVRNENLKAHKGRTE
jgi:hypothetical protein